MNKLSLALAALLFALPAQAERIPLSALSAYLNSFSTATGKFTQVNADGTISTGQVYINRPGRVRFEYDPPTPALVMAGGGQVAVFDPKSNQPPEQYPLSRTPLNLILERNVDLSRARMVVGHSSDGKTTRVVAQDPEHPDYGSITLVFTAAPVELRQWVIDDGSGATTVILGDLKTGMRLPASLFSIVQETRKRTGSD
ncbi:outer membrane lipoprotein-sorting protein [Rhodovulum imhoffii]|uniref:Outer membrane lipoprotein-sorting protein n=1 Tax=Rhodovulum imhoffii TaxID=365340 RepID=A0A2T5BUX4_9RHOB|nr:outer membrane lipoprotein carrier protein LolA [Rhodovulum imhoffii]MBK5934691.1 cell envelope biogenesis protein LolA [Rhodovulum imhoffii]PTN03333.1 outer membrane lipoprotein-sorting protein [Rhodovulum imhoffii]